MKNKMNKKYNILLFIKLPPPVTGATQMNQYVADSESLKNKFNIETIRISYNQTVNNLGNIKFSKLLNIIKYSLLLIKKLLFFKPDLTYFQISPLGFAFIRDSLYVFIMKVFNAKIVYHIHGKGIVDQISNPINRLIYKSVFKNQEVITLSKLLDYDIRPIFDKDVYHVSNGIPIMQYNKKEKVDNSMIKILFLSNLIKSKGILDFIEAMEILRIKGIRFVASVVGDEGDLSSRKLKNIIKDKGLDNFVSYCGPKFGDEKNQMYLNSDIFVFPTTNDIFGLVNIEAMQFSIPVISTNEGAIPEIVKDGITGFIVEKNAPHQIAEKIEFLISHHELRKKMGKAGRKKFLEKYTLQVFEKNLCNVFNEILNK